MPIKTNVIYLKWATLIGIIISIENKYWIFEIATSISVVIPIKS